MASLTVAQYALARLVQLGIDRIFGVPGDYAFSIDAAAGTVLTRLAAAKNPVAIVTALVSRYGVRDRAVKFVRRRSARWSPPRPAGSWPRIDMLPMTGAAGDPTCSASFYPRLQRQLCAGDTLVIETGTCMTHLNKMLLPEAFGCKGWIVAKVTTNAELDTVLAKIAAEDAPAYVEVMIPNEESQPLPEEMIDSGYKLRTPAIG